MTFFGTYGPSINLALVRTIEDVSVGKGRQVRLTFVGGEKMLVEASAFEMECASWPVVKAEPGFTFLSANLSTDDKLLVFREPIIAWRISTHSRVVAPMAITPSGCSAEYYALLYPDGQAIEPYGGCFASEDEWVKDVGKRIREDEARTKARTKQAAAKEHA